MEAVNLWPEDGWAGALQAIPIYICAFACHFNVLPVHGELAKPTRERLHRMVSNEARKREKVSELWSSVCRVFAQVLSIDMWMPSCASFFR